MNQWVASAKSLIAAIKGKKGKGGPVKISKRPKPSENVGEVDGCDPTEFDEHDPSVVSPNGDGISVSINSSDDDYQDGVNTSSDESSSEEESDYSVSESSSDEETSRGAAQAVTKGPKG